MEFVYEKKSNVHIGDKLFVIIRVSTRTYDGVYEAIVDSIDWNEEEVIFKVDQPCEYVSATFNDMKRYVFTTKEEAEKAEESLEFGEGLFEY